MGKATGFLDYAREGNPAVKPKERIKNFNEFHKTLSVDERRIQGARCMNCGVPFCQSGMMLNGMATGCPLHNLIPEWNDEIYNNNWEHALSRLLKTSSFPEFTGRVCPALCEAACTCGMNDTPVTVKENELALIENGFKNGYIKPRIPAVRTDKKVAVIGSGPSGLAVADMLNRRGHNVTVYEKNDRLGGLLMYGIPNMKLEKSIIDRRINLMKAEGVEFITNADVGNGIDAKEIIKNYDAVVLCCGAGNPRDINAKGRSRTKGIYFAVDFLTMNTKSLLNSGFKDGQYINAKGKNVVIVGGGDTGNDCTGTVIRHGCKSVVQIEMMPKLPDFRTGANPWPQWPKVCKTDYGQEEAIAVFGKDPRVYETTIKEIISDENGNLKAVKTVKIKQEKDTKTGMMAMKEVPGSEAMLDADILIIAAGFLGCNKYVAEAFGVKLNTRTNVNTSPDSYKTNIDKVFTAGDMHRGQSLVVWGIAEGRAAAKEIDEYLMGYSNMV
ncbi:glutamate synthase [NADPH] small chain [Clostridiales bacterium]|nr:glutamate synthase [NADPH] small chain [Clostridiales bacterium]